MQFKTAFHLQKEGEN